MKYLLALAFLFASLAQAADLPVVPKVDLDRYAGRWYEIARLPHRFQEQCVGDVTAEYARREDGRIAVVNRCRRADGSFDEAQAVARVVDPQTNAKLEVSFLPAWLNWLPFWADYWVIALAPDYSYAVVGHPTREYLWVLSRTPQMPAETYAALLAQIEKLGYDPQRLRKTAQGQPADPPQK